MNKMLNIIKNKYAILALSAVASIFVAFNYTNHVVASNCPGTIPASPVFNYYPLTYSGESCHDMPLIDARRLMDNNGQFVNPDASRDNHYADSASEHSAGINANVGDTVRVSIYFHNGATDEESMRDQTTAHNVLVGTNFNSGATTDHTISGIISADNASSVSSSGSQYGGDIVVHTPVSTLLQYVSGSTELCLTNQAATERGWNSSNANNCGTDASGQTRYSQVISDGIENGTTSIGDIKSCFPYSGFVTFSVKVVQSSIVVTNNNLTISKQVRNLSTGTSFSSSTYAHQGDIVEYQVTLTNNGSSDLTNVTLRDPGANGISITNNSQIIYGMNFGNMQPGQTQTVTYDATVNYSSGTITNTATANSDQTNSVNSSAYVYLNNNVVTYGNLNINKQVRNITVGNSFFSKSTTAFTNDRVEYQIVVNNNGNNTLDNVVLTDILPSGLTLDTGSIQVDGNYSSQSFGQVYFGTMYSGQQHTVVYDATVNSGSGSNIINTASVTANNGNSAQDTASVFVHSVLGSNVNLSFSKRAFNDTQNVDATSVAAAREDFITYTLNVTNNGNATAPAFVITDDLSQVLNVATMADTKGGYMNGSTISWPAVDILPGQTISKQFRVRVNFNLPEGTLSMVNTYGNTVVVKIKGQVLGATLIAPKTGPEATYAFVFAGLLTAAFAIIKNKAWLKFVRK